MPKSLNPTAPPKLQIELQFASVAVEKSLSTITSPALIKKWVKEVTKQSGLLTLRFVNPAEAKRLNMGFRQKDKATNVLTFSYELSKKIVVADIIFCLPVVLKEAREQGKTVKAHLAHLIVHGCLHAQGLDHERSEDAVKMEKREIAILKALGFDDPYQDF
ncbi:rRNA maturation RNase YbeY [Polynucleobacter meluiroseus]|nr:rRNA maturation RNase YbeY [Polynucleobacter meluiroseus]